MRHYIRRNRPHPELIVENIAHALHVFVHTVLQTLSRYQVTPAAIIWQERLQVSRDMLVHGHVRSLSEAALDYGLCEFTHFRAGQGKMKLRLWG